MAHPISKPPNKGKVSSTFVLLLAALFTVLGVALGFWGTKLAGDEAEQAADIRARKAENHANLQISALKEIKAMQDGGQGYAFFDMTVWAHDTNRLNLSLTHAGKFDMHAVSVTLRDNFLLNELMRKPPVTVDSMMSAFNQADEVLPIPDGYLKTGTSRLFDIQVPPNTMSVSKTAYIEAKNGHWMQNMLAHRISGKWEFYVTLQGSFIDGVKVIRHSNGFPVEGLNNLIYQVSQ